MNILSLDVGNRHTGCAIAHAGTGVPLPLPTLEHTHYRDLVRQALLLAQEKCVDLIVLGLPLLLSGQEGEQAKRVRSVEHLLAENGMKVVFIDERYTSAGGKNDHAKAACALLLTYLDSAGESEGI